MEEGLDVSVSNEDDFDRLLQCAFSSSPVDNPSMIAAVGDIHTLRFLVVPCNAILPCPEPTWVKRVRDPDRSRDRGPHQPLSSVSFVETAPLCPPLGNIPR
jgi:hypothetical protein